MRNKNKALHAQVDEVNNAHASALSDLSKLLEEKSNLETMLSNLEASMQVLTSSLVSIKKEVQKKDEEITTLWDACIDKFAEGANHMKTILLQDFKEGRHLSWNVDQFLAEQEKA